MLALPPTQLILCLLVFFLNNGLEHGVEGTKNKVYTSTCVFRNDSSFFKLFIVLPDGSTCEVTTNRNGCVDELKEQGIVLSDVTYNPTSNSYSVELLASQIVDVCCMDNGILTCFSNSSCPPVNGDSVRKDEYNFTPFFGGNYSNGTVASHSCGMFWYLDGPSSSKCVNGMFSVVSSCKIKGWIVVVVVVVAVVLFIVLLIWCFVIWKLRTGTVRRLREYIESLNEIVGSFRLLTVTRETPVTSRVNTDTNPRG